MGVAIAICIVAYFAYDYDATFDSIHTNRATLYRVSSIREFSNTSTHYGYAPLPLGELANKTFSDISQSSRYNTSQSNFKREDDLFPANLTYVDSDFFSMFSFEFIVGNPDDLKDKTTVFISETMAERLFRTSREALGKMLTQVYGNTLKEVKIAGVFREQPMNSSFHKRGGSAFMNIENYKDEFEYVRFDDWKLESTVFIQIDDPARIEVVHQQFQSYLDNNNQARPDFQVKEFVLDPFPPWPTTTAQTT